MVTEYRHGIDTIEVDDAIRPVQTGPSNVIGLVGTAMGADVAKFPLNTPVLIAGDPRAAASLGSDGTLPDAVDGIFNQFGADVVVVRVQDNNDPNAQLSNVVGLQSSLTGLWALKKSQSILGLVPKLNCAPGFTQRRPTDGVASVTPNAGGAGYVQATTTVTITGDGFGAEFKPVVQNGSVVAFTKVRAGWGYTHAEAVISGAGHDATATPVLGAVANPVVAESIGICRDMRGIFIADTPGTNYADAVAYRGDFDSDRLWLVEGGVKVWNALDNSAVVQPVAARLAGMQAYIDQKRGFWWSASNQALNNVIGVNRPIDWSFFSSTVEGQLLNSQGIGVVIRDNGFRVMGVRSPTSDTLWQFLPVRRTADMVYDTIENAMRIAIDRPINVGTIDWIEGTVNAYLRDLANVGAIIDGKAWLDRTINTPTQLSAGHLYIDFDLEPPAPLERLTFRAHRNAGYYTEVVNQVLANAA